VADKEDRPEEARWLVALRGCALVRLDASAAYFLMAKCEVLASTVVVVSARPTLISRGA